MNELPEMDEREEAAFIERLYAMGLLPGTKKALSWLDRLVDGREDIVFGEPADEAPGLADVIQAWMRHDSLSAAAEGSDGNEPDPSKLILLESCDTDAPQDRQWTADLMVYSRPENRIHIEIWVRTKEGENRNPTGILHILEKAVAIKDGRGELDAGDIVNSGIAFEFTDCGRVGGCMKERE